MTPRAFVSALVVNVLIPVGLIAGTIYWVRPMLDKKKPDRTDQQEAPSLESNVEHVEVFALRPTKARSKLESTGVTAPRQRMTVVPELSARVTWVSPNLMVGGQLSKGELLVRLDKKDLELKLRAQRNQIAKAQLDLEVEKERANLAKRELALLEQGQDLPANTNRSLATRTHHLKAAKMALDAAKSGIEQAQLQLQRSEIRAPFDAVVLSENVEPGQVVGPSSVMATLIGSKTLHVRASIPVSQLANLVLEGPMDKRSRAKVTLQGARYAAGQTAPSWVARADRLMHELDNQSMNAQVLFVVQNPFSTQGGRLPLLSGSLVKLEVQGSEVLEVYQIPRRALVEGQSLWTVNTDTRLHKIPLQVLWSGQDQVFAQSPELKPGLWALTRPPRSPIEGAKVETTQAPSIDAPEAR